jgi:hypothetical protein
LFHVTKSQILHLLTGLVLSPLAGAITAWLAQHFPGLPHLNTTEVTSIFATGTGVALSLAIHYLHGLQLWEQTIGRVIDVEDTTPAPKASAKK